MIARLSAGWQTTIADLALILFMVTAAGLDAQQQLKQPPRQQANAGPAPSGEPLAVYRVGDSAPPIGDWLAEQATDGRQYLTIVARYRPGGADTAAREALDLARRAGAAGVAARIVLEPGRSEIVEASLAFDKPPRAVAQSLQYRSQD